MHQSYNVGDEELVILAMTDFGLTERAYVGNHLKTTRLRGSQAPRELGREGAAGHDGGHPHAPGHDGGHPHAPGHDGGHPHTPGHDGGHPHAPGHDGGHPHAPGEAEDAPRVAPTLPAPSGE